MFNPVAGHVVGGVRCAKLLIRATSLFFRLSQKRPHPPKAENTTNVEVPQRLREGLRRRFDKAQLVELAAAIAWGNYRARFTRVFGVEAAGFSEEATFCALPEHRPMGHRSRAAGDDIRDA